MQGRAHEFRSEVSVVQVERGVPEVEHYNLSLFAPVLHLLPRIIEEGLIGSEVHIVLRG